MSSLTGVKQCSAHTKRQPGMSKPNLSKTSLTCKTTRRNARSLSTDRCRSVLEKCCSKTSFNDSKFLGNYPCLSDIGSSDDTVKSKGSTAENQYSTPHFIRIDESSPYSYSFQSNLPFSFPEVTPEKFSKPSPSILSCNEGLVSSVVSPDFINDNSPQSKWEAMEIRFLNDNREEGTQCQSVETSSTYSSQSNYKIVIRSNDTDPHPIPYCKQTVRVEKVEVTNLLQTKREKCGNLSTIRLSEYTGVHDFDQKAEKTLQNMDIKADQITSEIWIDRNCEDAPKIHSDKGKSGAAVHRNVEGAEDSRGVTDTRNRIHEGIDIGGTDAHRKGRTEPCSDSKGEYDDVRVSQQDVVSCHLVPPVSKSDNEETMSWEANRTSPPSRWNAQGLCPLWMSSDQKVEASDLFPTGVRGENTECPLTNSTRQVATPTASHGKDMQKAQANTLEHVSSPEMSLKSKESLQIVSTFTCLTSADIEAYKETALGILRQRKKDTEKRKELSPETSMELPPNRKRSPPNSEMPSKNRNSRKYPNSMGKSPIGKNSGMSFGKIGKALVTSYNRIKLQMDKHKMRFQKQRSDSQPSVIASSSQISTPIPTDSKNISLSSRAKSTWEENERLSSSSRTTHVVPNHYGSNMFTFYTPTPVTSITPPATPASSGRLSTTSENSTSKGTLVCERQQCPTGMSPSAFKFKQSFSDGVPQKRWSKHELLEFLPSLTQIPLRHSRTALDPSILENRERRSESKGKDEKNVIVASSSSFWLRNSIESYLGRPEESEIRLESQGKFQNVGNAKSATKGGAIRSSQDEASEPSSRTVQPAKAHMRIPHVSPTMEGDVSNTANYPCKNIEKQGPVGSRTFLASDYEDFPQSFSKWVGHQGDGRRETIAGLDNNEDHFQPQGEGVKTTGHMVGDGEQDRTIGYLELFRNILKSPSAKAAQALGHFFQSQGRKKPQALSHIEEESEITVDEIISSYQKIFAELNFSGPRRTVMKTEDGFSGPERRHAKAGIDCSEKTIASPDISKSIELHCTTAYNEARHLGTDRTRRRSFASLRSPNFKERLNKRADSLPLRETSGPKVPCHTLNRARRGTQATSARPTARKETKYSSAFPIELPVSKKCQTNPLPVSEMNTKKVNLSSGRVGIKCSPASTPGPDALSSPNDENRLLASESYTIHKRSLNNETLEPGVTSDTSIMCEAPSQRFPEPQGNSTLQVTRACSRLKTSKRSSIWSLVSPTQGSKKANAMMTAKPSKVPITNVGSATARAKQPAQKKSHAEAAAVVEVRVVNDKLMNPTVITISPATQEQTRLVGTFRSRWNPNGENNACCNNVRSVVVENGSGPCRAGAQSEKVVSKTKDKPNRHTVSSKGPIGELGDKTRPLGEAPTVESCVLWKMNKLKTFEKRNANTKPDSLLARSRQGKTQSQQLIYKRSPLAHSGLALGSKSPCRTAGQGTSKRQENSNNTAMGTASSEIATQTRVSPRVVSCGNVAKQNSQESATPSRNATGISQYRNNACHPDILKQRGADFQKQNAFKIMRSFSTAVLGSSHVTGLPVKNRSSPNVMRQTSCIVAKSVYPANVKRAKTKLKECNSSSICQLQQKPAVERETQAFRSKTAHGASSTSSYESEPILGPSSENNSPIILNKALTSSSTPHSFLVQDNPKNPNRNESQPAPHDQRRKIAANVEHRGNVNRPAQTRIRSGSPGSRENKLVPSSSQQPRAGNQGETASRGRKTPHLTASQVNNAYRNLSAVNLTKSPLKAFSKPTESQLHVNDGQVGKEGSRPLQLRDLSFQVRPPIRSERNPSEKLLVCASYLQPHQLPTSEESSKSFISNARDVHAINVNPATPLGPGGAVKRCNSSYNLLSGKPESESLTVTPAGYFAKLEVKSPTKESEATSLSRSDGVKTVTSLNVNEGTFANTGVAIVHESRLSNHAEQHHTHFSDVEKKETVLTSLKSVWNVEDESEKSEDDSSQMLRKETVAKTCEAILKECHGKLYPICNLGKETTPTVKPTSDSGVASPLITGKDSSGLTIAAPKEIPSGYLESNDERLLSVNGTAHHGLNRSTDGKGHNSKELSSVNARECSVGQTHGTSENVAVQCSERTQQLKETIPNREYEAKVNSVSEDLSWSADGMKSSLDLEKSKKERVNISQEDLSSNEDKKSEISEPINSTNLRNNRNEACMNQTPSTAILEDEAKNKRDVQHPETGDAGKERDAQGRQHQDPATCKASTRREEAEDTVYSSSCYRKEDRGGKGHSPPAVVTGLKTTSHDTSPTLVLVQNPQKKHDLPLNTGKDLSEILISGNSYKISFQDAKLGPDEKLEGQQLKVTPPFNITVLSPPTKPRPKVATTSPDVSRKTNCDSPIVCFGNDEIILKPTLGKFKLIFKAQSCTVDGSNQTNVGESDVVAAAKSPAAVHNTIASEETNVAHIRHQLLALTDADRRGRIELSATLDSNGHKENNIQGGHKEAVSMPGGAITCSSGSQYQHTQHTRPGDSKNAQLARPAQQQRQDARGPIWNTGDVKNAKRQTESQASTTIAIQYESRPIPPQGMSASPKSSTHVSTAMVREPSVDKSTIAGESSDAQGSVLPPSSENKFTTDFRSKKLPGQLTKTHKEAKINLNVINRKVMENIELFMKSACQNRSSAMTPTQAKAAVISRHHAASAPEFGNSFDCPHLHSPDHLLSTDKSKTFYPKANAFQTNDVAHCPMLSEQCLNRTGGIRRENANEKTCNPLIKHQRSSPDNPTRDPTVLQTHTSGRNSFNSPSFDALLKVWEASCTAEASTPAADMSRGKICKVERKNIRSIEDNGLKHPKYTAVGIEKQENQDLQETLRVKMNNDCQAFNNNTWDTICATKQGKKSSSAVTADTVLTEGIGLRPNAETGTGIHGCDSEELILFSDNSLLLIEPNQPRRRMSKDRLDKSTFSGSKLNMSIPTGKQLSEPSSRGFVCSEIPPLLDAYPELLSETKQDPFGEQPISVTGATDSKHPMVCNLLLPEKTYRQFPNILKDAHQMLSRSNSLFPSTEETPEYQKIPFSPSDIDRVFGCSKSVTSVDDKPEQDNECPRAENPKTHPNEAWTAPQNIMSLSEDSIVNSHRSKEADIGFVDLIDLEVDNDSEASTANLLSEFENEYTNHTSYQHSSHRFPSPHGSNTQSRISDVTDKDARAAIVEAYDNAATSGPVNFHHSILKLNNPRESCCSNESPCTLRNSSMCSAVSDSCMRNVTAKPDMPSMKPSHINLEILKTVTTLTTKFLDFFRRSNTTREEVKNKRSWSSKRKNRLKRLRPPTSRNVLSVTIERAHLQDPSGTIAGECTRPEGLDSEGCIPTCSSRSNNNLNDDIVDDSEQIATCKDMTHVTTLEHEPSEPHKAKRALNRDIVSCRDVIASLAQNLLVTDNCDPMFQASSSELHDVSAGHVGTSFLNILFTARIRQPNVHLNKIVSVYIPSLLPYHPVLRIRVAKEHVDSGIVKPLNSMLPKNLCAGIKTGRAPETATLNGRQKIVENAKECLVCQTKGFQRYQRHFQVGETSTVFVDIREQRDDEGRWQGIFAGQFENESLDQDHDQGHEPFHQGFPTPVDDSGLHERVMFMTTTTGDGQDLPTQRDSRRTSNLSDFKESGSRFGFRNSPSFIPYPFPAAQMQYEEPYRTPPHQDTCCTLAAQEVGHHCRAGCANYKTQIDDTLGNMEELGFKNGCLFQKELPHSTAHRITSRYQPSARERLDRRIECIFLDTDRKFGGWARRSPTRFERIENARRAWGCDMDCTKASSYWVPFADNSQEDHELANSTTMSDHIIDVCGEWFGAGYEEEFVGDQLVHDEYNQDTCEELGSLMTELNDSTLRETPSITDTSFESWTKDQDQNISSHTNGEIIHYILKTNARTTGNVGPAMKHSDNSHGHPQLHDGHSEFHNLRQTSDKNCLYILTENEDKSTSVSQGMCKRYAHGEMLEKSTQALLRIPEIPQPKGTEPPVSCQTQTDGHRTTSPAPLIKGRHMSADSGQEIVGIDVGSTRFQCYIKKGGVKCFQKHVSDRDSPSSERKCENESEAARTPSLTLGGSQVVDHISKQHKWTYNLITAGKDQDKTQFSKSNKGSKKTKRSKERTGIIMDYSEKIIGEFDVHSWKASTVHMRRRKNRKPLDDDLEQTDSNVSRCSYSLCACYPPEKSQNLSYADAASYGLVTSECGNSTVHLWPGSITWSRSACKDPPPLSSCSTKRDLSSRFPSTVSACIDLRQNTHHDCNRLILNSVPRELLVNEPSDSTPKAGGSRAYNHPANAATASDPEETYHEMHDHLACDRKDFGDQIYDPAVSPDCSLYEHPARGMECSGKKISSAELQARNDLSEHGNTTGQTPEPLTLGVRGTERKEPSSNEHVETPASVTCHQPYHTQNEDDDGKDKCSNDSDSNNTNEKCTCEYRRDAHSLNPLIRPNDRKLCEYSKFEDTLSNLIKPGLCLDKDIRSKESENASWVGPGDRTLELKAPEPSDSSSTSSLLYDYGNLQNVLSNESKLLWKTLTKLEQNYDFCKMCKKRYKSLMSQLRMKSGFAQAVGKRLDNDQGSNNAGTCRLAYPVLTGSHNSGNVEYDHVTHRKDQEDLYPHKPSPILKEIDASSEMIKHHVCDTLHNTPTTLTKAIADLPECPFAPGETNDRVTVLTVSVTEGSANRPCPKVSCGSVTSLVGDGREEKIASTPISISHVQIPGPCYDTGRDSQGNQNCLSGLRTRRVSKTEMPIESLENDRGFKDGPEMVDASNEGYVNDQPREEDFSHLRTTHKHSFDVAAFESCGIESCYEKAETEKDVSCHQHASLGAGTSKCSTSEVDKNPFASSEKIPDPHECPLALTSKVSVPRSLPFEHSRNADADTLIEKLGTILNEIHQTFPDTPRMSPIKSTSTQILPRSHNALERYLNIHRNSKRPMGNISLNTQPTSCNTSYPPSPPAPSGIDPIISEKVAAMLLEKKDYLESVGLKSFGSDQSVWIGPSQEFDSVTDAVDTGFNRPSAAESKMQISPRPLLGNQSAKVGSTIKTMDWPRPYSEPQAAHAAVNCCAPALVCSETGHHLPNSPSYPSLRVSKFPVTSLSSYCTASSVEARDVPAPGTETFGSVKNLVGVFEGKDNNSSHGLDVLQQVEVTDMDTLAFQPQETEVIKEICPGKAVSGEFHPESKSEKEKYLSSQVEHLNKSQSKQTEDCCIPFESSFTQPEHLNRGTLSFTDTQGENSQNINRGTVSLMDAQCENSQNKTRSSLSLKHAQRGNSQNINRGTLSLTDSQCENSLDKNGGTLSLSDAQRVNSQNINRGSLSFTDAQRENSQNTNRGTLSLTDAQRENSPNITRGTLSLTGAQRENSPNINRGTLSVTGAQRENRGTLSFTDAQRGNSQNINTGTLSFTDAQRGNSLNINRGTLLFTNAQSENSQNINRGTLSLTDAQHENSHNINGDTLSFTNVKHENSQNINRGTLSFTDIGSVHSQCMTRVSLSLTSTERRRSEAMEKNNAFTVGSNCPHLDFETEPLPNLGSSMACANDVPEAVRGLGSRPKSLVVLPDAQPKGIHSKMLEQGNMAAVTALSKSEETTPPALVERTHETTGGTASTSTQRLHCHDEVENVNFAEEADEVPHYIGEIDKYVLAEPQTNEESNDVQNCALRDAGFGEDKVNVDLFQLNDPSETHPPPVFGDVCDLPQSWTIDSCDETQAETGVRSLEEIVPRPVEIPVDIYTVPMWSSLHETTKKQRVKRREEEVPTRTVVISGPIINMSMPVCRHRSGAATSEVGDGPAICETHASVLNTAPAPEGADPHADCIQALGPQEFKATGWKSAIKRILPFGKGTARKDASSRTPRRQWKNS